MGELRVARKGVESRLISVDLFALCFAACGYDPCPVSSISQHAEDPKKIIHNSNTLPY